MMQEHCLAEVEMPGQHLRGTEVTADTLVHLDRVGCDVAVVRRHGASARCVPQHSYAWLDAGLEP